MRFNRYLYKYWSLQATLILLGLFTLPFSLVNPYLSKFLIDNAYANKDIRSFLIIAVIGGCIFIFNGLMSSLNDYISQRIEIGVHFDITKDVFRHLQSLSMSFFNDKSTGEHLFRISNDIGTVVNFVCNLIPQIAILLPRILFILIIVFYLNFKLALLTFLLVPISFFHSYFFGKWLEEMTRRMIEKFQGIFSGLHESFTHIFLIKALGKEDYETKKFERELSKRMDFEKKNARLSNISSFLSSLLNKVISGIIALYGGYEVIKGNMTLGSLTAVMIYLTQLTGLIKSIGSFYETIAINSVSCQRVCEILDIKPEITDGKGALDFSFQRGKIEFRNVWFGYKQDNFVLQNINFSIEPASKIALVGTSGCGKTTLLSLILRLYDIEKGDILIDGISVKDIKLKSLKHQIGIALQQPFLWNDTVSNNILYGAQHIDAIKEELFEASKLAEAHHFIINLVKGYDSIIGEMACKISEGQKQRIAIARALIKKPKILILDEAMSSLDSETEDKIMDNIMREFYNSTLIVVSHRLSTVKKMDLVYYFASPNHMEIDVHQELIEKNSEYKQLFATQAEEM